jgi:hypothetical protein
LRENWHFASEPLQNVPLFSSRYNLYRFIQEHCLHKWILWQCAPVAGQQSRDKQTHNIRYWVTALQTNNSNWIQQWAVNRHERNNGTATEERCSLRSSCRYVTSHRISRTSQCSVCNLR